MVSRPRLAAARPSDGVLAGRAGHDALLIAPYGGGKTLAGFMPNLEKLVAKAQPAIAHFICRR